mmetsp:Transcript_37531/g.75174  ORF Transcript_37531/g.75174 Transcript_37531/m.75174 type:complete len:306 (+) Transcript_37531:274-1191(+)
MGRHLQHEPLRLRLARQLAGQLTEQREEPVRVPRDARHRRRRRYNVHGVDNVLHRLGRLRRVGGRRFGRGVARAREGGEGGKGEGRGELQGGETHVVDGIQPHRVQEIRNVVDDVLADLAALVAENVIDEPRPRQTNVPLPEFCGRFEEALESSPPEMLVGRENHVLERRLKLGISEHSAGNVGVGVIDDLELTVDLDGEALEDAEAAYNGGVVGRELKRELIHDVPELADHVFYVEGVDRRAEHVWQRLVQRVNDRRQVGPRRDEAQPHVELAQLRPVAVDHVDHRLQDAVPLELLHLAHHPKV